MMQRWTQEELDEIRAVAKREAATIQSSIDGGETMTNARVSRPKGITVQDWQEFIDLLGEYQGMDPADPDNEVILQEKAEGIADKATALFLEPITP
jgi:hypothetical protein